jgi:hypothetical protein
MILSHFIEHASIFRADVYRFMNELVILGTYKGRGKERTLDIANGEK